MTSGTSNFNLHPAPVITVEEPSKDTVSSDSSIDEELRDMSYRNESYWALPESVREIVDQSKRKNAHSEFYHALKKLNERILIFRIVFYTKKPKFETEWIEAKKRKLANDLIKD